MHVYIYTSAEVHVTSDVPERRAAEVLHAHLNNLQLPHVHLPVMSKRPGCDNAAPAVAVWLRSLTEVIGASCDVLPLRLKCLVKSLMHYLAEQNACMREAVPVKPEHK